MAADQASVSDACGCCSWVAAADQLLWVRPAPAMVDDASLLHLGWTLLQMLVAVMLDLLHELESLIECTAGHMQAAQCTRSEVQQDSGFIFKLSDL